MFRNQISNCTHRHAYQAQWFNTISVTRGTLHRPRERGYTDAMVSGQPRQSVLLAPNLIVCLYHSICTNY